MSAKLFNGIAMCYRYFEIKHYKIFIYFEVKNTVSTGVRHIKKKSQQGTVPIKYSQKPLNCWKCFWERFLKI